MNNLNSGRELLSLSQNASGSYKSTCVWIRAHHMDDHYG